MHVIAIRSNYKTAAKGREVGLAAVLKQPMPFMRRLYNRREIQTTFSSGYSCGYLKPPRNASLHQYWWRVINHRISDFMTVRTATK